MNREGIDVRDRDDDWHVEVGEWLESLHAVIQIHGKSRADDLLRDLMTFASRQGLQADAVGLATPYRNTISVDDQERYPGDITVEKRIEDVLRWNAMAMVLKASDAGYGVGGHIATYASAATMLEIGFNHFFTNRSDDYGGDIVNIQPHASPGIYARAYLEGRLTLVNLENFRRELEPEVGLCSYPHPRRMPDFWPCPTASMGLSTILSIYLARFAKYLDNRGLKPRNGGRIWCFIGDGETDEPEVLGGIGVAAREHLDNLILVVNCNLQRLDGPVRGNGKIIQELERKFLAADWCVQKVIWGSAWDELLARDTTGILQDRMERARDGDYQLYSVLPGDEVRAHWVGSDPNLERLMHHLTDEEIRSICRGGHDHRKLFSAFHKATQVVGKPVVILVKTIKGYGMGSSSEGQNIVHQKKTMSDADRLACARALGIPLSEPEILRADFYHPSTNSEEYRYIRARRQEKGGFQPFRDGSCIPIEMPSEHLFEKIFKGTNRRISTTMALVGLIGDLLRDENVGQLVVPIVPDEARTFGLDSLFRRAGIYSAEPQLYEPVDAKTISPYRESSKGQILQEGICEAGALASFHAAGTAYAHFGVPTIPFYMFYSMFGFQRVGDLIWACADALCRGFLVGATAGRTTLNGEGLQHQDGHSHVMAYTVPNLRSYDPSFAFELAVVVRDGLRRMYVDKEDTFYYLTVYNENYEQPAMPAGIEEGILRGLYHIGVQIGLNVIGNQSKSTC